MPRTAADEKVRHRPMRCVASTIPARRPADHLELMIVATAYDIAACVRQSPYHFQMTGCCRPVHGVGVVALFSSIGVESSLQKEIDRCEVAFHGCRMQQRPFIGLRS